MERKMAPKILTFGTPQPAALHLIFAPGKAHLLNIGEKKLMNSGGYPQASQITNRLTVSRRDSPQTDPDGLASIRNLPFALPKILTLVALDRCHWNSGAFIFQAFAVSEYQLAPEKPHL
jgi:hypothetical protein